MAFVVITETDEMFVFDGQLAANKGKIVFRGQDAVRIFKTGQILAIMRQDFADEYASSMKELDRLKRGDPNQN